MVLHQAKPCCAVNQAVNSPVGSSHTQLLTSSIMTRMYLKPLPSSRPSSPNGPLAPTEIVEMDDFARPGAVHGLPKRTRHLLPRFRIHAMETLCDELGDMLLRAKPTTVFRQSLEGSQVATAPRWPTSFMWAHTINRI